MRISCTSLLHRNESRSPCLVAGAAFATHLIGESELRRLPKEVCVTVAVPLGLSKKIVKRSLCNSRCAIGIQDAENLERLYGTRCAIGIWCKLLPKINKYLNVRNVAARFGYFLVFCWMPLCHWDCHKMM